MQGASIAQRIALEGEQDIKNALKELGEVGEKSFAQVESAAGLSNSHLLVFSNIVAGIRGHIENAHRAFEPVIEQFGEMREGANRFGEALTNVGERIMPNFKEMVALGAAAGVAGLVEFIKAGAEAAKETGDLARGLGLSVEKFQALRGAAALAGVEGGKFTMAMSRFAANAEKAVDTQVGTIGDIAKAVFGNVSTLGTEVLRGAQQQAQGISATVIRGARDMMNATNSSFVSIDSRIASSIQKNTELGRKIIEIANLVQGVGASAGIPQANRTSLQQIGQTIANIAAQGNAAGESMRNFIAQMGGRNLIPATNAFEALDRYTKGWKEQLQESVTMLQRLPSGEIVRKTLEDAFLETADKIAEMKNDIQRLAFIRENFGRDATRFGTIFKNGAEGIKDFMTEFTKLGIAISPEETILGSKFTGALEHFETAITNLRTAAAVGLSPALTPMVEEMTVAVGRLFPAVRQWSAETANRLAPGLRELAEYIGSATEKTQVHEQWVKTLIGTWEGAIQVFKFVSGAFSAISEAADQVAKVVNEVFGTHFTGLSLVAILAIGKVTGAFALLSATVGLFLDTLGLVARSFTWIVTTAADLGLIRAAVTAVRAAFGGLQLFLVEFFSLQSISSLFGPVLAAIGPAGWLVLALGATIAALYVWKGSWEEVFKFLQEGWDNLKGTVGAFIDMVKAAAEALGRLFAKGADIQSQAAAAGLSGEGMATGGFVRGPGGIDTVPIWATAGEFMMRTAAVAKYGLGFMHAINTLSMPRLGYATGGPIMSPPPFGNPGIFSANAAEKAERGRYFTLSIEGHDWHNLMAPEDTANSMISYARNKATVRTGRMPEWKP